MTTTLYPARPPVPTMTRGFTLYHAWTRRWPSPNRTYLGCIWSGSPAEAASAARELAGPGRVIDIQGRRHGNMILKSA